jgi:hypothetical protein
MSNIFAPAWNSLITITNSATATSAVAIPKNCNAIEVTNTGTARVYIIVTYYESEGAALPTGIEPTLTAGYPILPTSKPFPI